ncbi:hypothetical protein NL108_004077 [Boleophthalmus pectinirostris]|uniref:transmembrane protein 238-like n=1 Tax=Boleophthalmus pectinirostris TaxID=150288 RepID=UPI002431B29E|nr:transmembrane protein 238-like [Boleophthalmus pectinirostris]KAJ0060231.1 hypothetical protein NL108_004077 [Boleophthalmus pectinirostris]
MSTSVQVEHVTEKVYGGVGRCKCSFWFAVAHDILGVFIIMVGVFGGLAVHDLFVYAGAIIIFLSLIWWIFWYSGNIDVPPEDLLDDVGLQKVKNRGLTKVVRRVSDRLSTGIRNSFRKNGKGSMRGSTAGPAVDQDVRLATIFDNNIISSPSMELTRNSLVI